MKKRSLLVSGALLLAAGAALAATLTVMVEKTQVRQRPQFFAPVVATVRLGDHLSGQDAGGGWYQISGDVEGYIHSSAVTSKRVQLAARSAGSSSTSAEEVTLAGKGFNEQVEQSYKAQHKDLDFKKVDAMEKRTVGDTQVYSFMKAGGLLPVTAKGGGQ